MYFSPFCRIQELRHIPVRRSHTETLLSQKCKDALLHSSSILSPLTAIHMPESRRDEKVQRDKVHILHAVKGEICNSLKVVSRRRKLTAGKLSGIEIAGRKSQEIQLGPNC